MSTVGENIKRIRKLRGYTQADLGEKCGMVDSAIRRYESGAYYKPKLETVQKIANALQVPISEIYGWDNSGENNLNDSGMKFNVSQIIMAKSILENAIDSDSYSVMHKAILEVYEILKEFGANK